MRKRQHKFLVFSTSFQKMPDDSGCNKQDADKSHDFKGRYFENKAIFFYGRWGGSFFLSEFDSACDFVGTFRKR